MDIYIGYCFLIAANKYAELHGHQKKEGKKDGGKKEKAKSTPKKKVCLASVFRTKENLF